MFSTNNTAINLMSVGRVLFTIGGFNRVIQNRLTKSRAEFKYCRFLLICPHCISQSHSATLFGNCQVTLSRTVRSPSLLLTKLTQLPDSCLPSSTSGWTPGASRSPATAANNTTTAASGEGFLCGDTARLANNSTVIGSNSCPTDGRKGSSIPANKSLLAKSHDRGHT